MRQQDQTKKILTQQKIIFRFWDCPSSRQKKSFVSGTDLAQNPSTKVKEEMNQESSVQSRCGRYHKQIFCLN